MPIHDELYARDDRTLTCGGAALNSARCCNFILRKEGHAGKVGFVGCVHEKDDAGNKLKEALNDAGMIACFDHTTKENTGRCAVVIKGTERTLCANIGASACYTNDHFEDHAKKMFAKANAIYTTGFFITSNVEVLRKVGDFAVEHNKPLFFNIAAVFLFFIAKDDVMSCIEKADFVFCNEDEGSQYCLANGLEKDDRVAGAKHMAAYKKANTKRPRYAIITQGPDRVIIAKHTPGSDAEAEVTFVDSEKVPVADIVDTNGAGDSFVGGFLAAYTNGKEVEDCVKAGIKMATIVV